MDFVNNQGIILILANLVTRLISQITSSNYLGYCGKNLPRLWYRRLLLNYFSKKLKILKFENIVGDFVFDLNLLAAGGIKSDAQRSFSHITFFTINVLTSFYHINLSNFFLHRTM